MILDEKRNDEEEGDVSAAPKGSIMRSFLDNGPFQAASRAVKKKGAVQDAEGDGVFNKHVLPGEKHVVEINPDQVFDKKTGLVNGDKFVSEAKKMYDSAIEKNSAKFFDAFLKAVAVFTGLSVQDILTPLDFTQAMKNFTQNISALNATLEQGAEVADVSREKEEEVDGE